jgi:hypothetical protein
MTANTLTRLTGLAAATASAVASLLVATAAQAAESYTLWDNFNNQTAVDASKWQNLERTRILKDGVARFAQRDIGTQSEDSGASYFSWGMNLRNPSVVRQMRAIVTMTDYTTVGCTNNATSTFVQARMIGEFFSSETNAPTSRINDVGATVRLYRSSFSTDGAGVVRIEGVVYKCTTTDCNTAASLGSVDLGTTTLNTAETLRVEWEPDLNRFNFQRGTNPSQSITYVESDARPPFSEFRQIGTRTQVATCFSGPRGEAMVGAKFENFAVNASAIP